MGQIVPFQPVHKHQWLTNHFAHNYHKKKYDKFKWWRSYVPKNTPLSNRAPLKDRIDNGDFDQSSYYLESQLVEHTINNKYEKLAGDQGRYIQETSVDRARRKRLLEDFEKDESTKLVKLVQDFNALTGIGKDTIENEMENFDGTLPQFYQFFTKKYPRANGLAYL